MASNVKALPKRPPPPVIEEEDPPDCPRCPPVGAPAWMATFADMATLLMAFFVLILAFANFDDVSFSKLSGTMREAFGTQIIVPFHNPTNSTVIEMDSRPKPTPPSDAEPTDPKEGGASTTNPIDDAAEALTRAIRQAMADGEITVEGGAGKVTVKLPENAGPEQAQTLADALAQAAGTTAQPSGEGTGEGTASGDSNASYQAGIAEARLQMALREEVAQGLVALERRDGKVFVTIGAGGAFPSGSDALTADAIEIMQRLGAAAAGKNATVTVTGHTDNVPISGGAFRDNWDLAAGRASAVVRALADTGAVDPAQMTAISKGESAPVADNATAEGREQNRRIEIEMTFANPGTEGPP